jgi:hypothetical protein
MLEAGATLHEMESVWVNDSARFLADRERALLYPV